MKKIAIRLSKVVAWAIGVILVLFILIAVAIQIPYVQNKLKDYAVSFVHGKIGTPVSLDRIEIAFPKKVVVKGIYVESQQRDTLLYSKYLGVDISLLKLLKNKVEVSSLELDGLKTVVKRDSLQTFNFDYIIEAFASETEQEESDSSMEIALGDISLQNIAVRFDDDFEGHHLDFKLNSFVTRFKDIDLTAMRYDISKIGIDGVYVDYLKQPSLNQVAKALETSVDTAKTVLPQLELGQLSFVNFDINYRDQESKVTAKMLLGEFQTSFKSLDLQNQDIALNEVKLEDFKASVQLGKRHVEKTTVHLEEASPSEANEQSQVKALEWKVAIGDIILNEIDVAYDDDNQEKVLSGLDPNHLEISDLRFRMKDLLFVPNTLSGKLDRFTFQEKSGFALTKFQTYFLYSNQTAFLKDFVLQTPNTQVNTSIVLNYTDVDQLINKVGDTSIDAVVSNTFLGLKDVDILMPGLLSELGYAELKNENIRLDAKANGKVNDLTLEHLVVKTLKSTYLTLDGKVKGLPDANKAYLDLQLKDILTTATDVQVLAPKGSMPEEISIPSKMSLKGFVRGTMKDVTSQMALKTSLGDVDLSAKFDQRLKGKEAYFLDLKLKELQVGKLIQNDSIGNVSLVVHVNGTSLDSKTIKADAAIELIKAQFNGYDYNHLRLDASIDKGAYKISSVNTDSNLAFDIGAQGLWTDEYISLQLLANVQNVDLYQLKLSDEFSRLTTVVDVQMDNILPDSLSGKFQIRDFAFASASRKFSLKPIDFIAVAKPNYRKMNLSSQIIDFDMTGDYRLPQLGNALKGTLAYYFKSIKSEEDTQKTLNKENQSFVYDLKVKYDKVYTSMLPNLKVLEPIHISGKYDQVTDYLSLNGEISNLVYGGSKIEGVQMNVVPNNDALTYSFGIGSIANESVRLRRLSLHGRAKDNKLTYDFNLKDKQDVNCYIIAGELETIDNVLVSRLRKDGFMLDYDQWEVSSDNRIVVGAEGIYVKDLALSNDAGGIVVESKEEIGNSPLHIGFNNFSIESLTKMAKNDKLLASGLINGSLDFEELSSDFRFVSDIDISHLHAMEVLIGNLHIGVSNESLSKYLANVVLEGGPNRVSLNGSADVEEGSIEMNVVIDQLQMSALERFTMNSISGSEGYFSGDIAIGGKFDKPSVLGDFKMNNVGFHVEPINADFRKINETIAFTDKGVEFDKFSITDSNGNLLVVNGAVLTKNYQDFAFDLGINAVDFQAINSTAKDNDLVYGTLVFDSNIQIKGNMDKPIVNGSIEVGKKTNLTVVMPQEDPSIADREGIVEFIDQESLQAAELKKLQEELNNSQIKGLDVSLAIKVDKDATFTMLMDKQSGDKLILKGEGEIMGGIDPSGKVNLTGRYEFREGSYDLSFNMMKRKFEVQKGSSIVFAGEPTDAILDLTAIYEVSTAPIDLLQNQLATLSPTQQNQYKQKIPFQALLKMKGELLEPELSFDIKLKEGVTSATGDVINDTKNKLTQLRANESELNKQVFALLLLNRFIGENPFESSAGGMTAGAIARQSVNRLLSDQLNNLASSLIKGVELNFNLESSEDFSSGSRENRTDLNIAVSKRLFSDRLKVTVGSSFEVEGSQRQNEQATNIAGDIELEYTLSKDGRYLMRVYRKNQYEVALQGQVVETGVGFIITMSYDKFRELFERSRDKKELKRQLKDESEK
ncbi:translocation/assembly module TamB domain-containing protein [Myroides pelagicus]|uniref:Translocation/assembly module TamB n=1 Tax=Myroides pelagicus TaxID=270914 RepID=A0A7K1GM67_9FLAO|nr:translocation/assembly module TamB domain-containing protein [Myroides pelagicus]MTH29977.1 translocation/assembly module TamB [Myroides pelagicus]